VIRSRREFLRAAVPALAAGLVGAGCSRAPDRAPPAAAEPLDPETVLAAYFAPESLGRVAAIGRVWLDGRADPTLAPAIDEALTAGREEEAVDRLRTAVRSDFRAGELVTVEGWHLARTEVHLCGLAELTRGAP